MGKITCSRNIKEEIFVIISLWKPSKEEADRSWVVKVTLFQKAKDINGSGEVLR